MVKVTISQYHRHLIAQGRLKEKVKQGDVVSFLVEYGQCFQVVC